MTSLARIRTVFTGVAGTPWYSNLTFDANEASGADYALFVADFWTSLRDLIYNGVAWSVQPEYTVFDDITGLVTGVGTWDGSAGTGNGSGDPLPYANQGLISMRTGVYVGGRQIRGKMFFPGLVETAATNAIMTPGVRLAIQEAAEELLSDANGAWRIYSRKNATSAAVTAVSTASAFAVLRSRRD